MWPHTLIQNNKCLFTLCWGRLSLTLAAAGGLISHVARNHTFKQNLQEMWYHFELNQSTEGFFFAVHEVCKTGQGPDFSNHKSLEMCVDCSDLRFTRHVWLCIRYWYHSLILTARLNYIDNNKPDSCMCLSVYHCARVNTDDTKNKQKPRGHSCLCCNITFTRPKQKSNVLISSILFIIFGLISI